MLLPKIVYTGFKYNTDFNNIYMYLQKKKPTLILEEGFHWFKHITKKLCIKLNKILWYLRLIFTIDINF